MSGQLEIRDLRTGLTHKVSVHEGNYVDASDLSKIGHQNQSTNARSGSLRILDRGFQHTACMESEITHVDGAQGRITIRGRSIQDLFRNCDFEQVMHLLIWGSLPTPDRLREIRKTMAGLMLPPKLVIDVIQSLPRDASVYSMLLAGLTAFTASDSTVRDNQNSLRPTFHGNMAKADQAIVRTLAYYAGTVALVHCHRESREIQSPDPELSLTANLLRMMGESTPALVALFDKIWILYADHEMTASTAAVLHTGATLADPLSSVIAGVTAGYGPLHAGAINLAYEQLKGIGSVEGIPAFLKTVRAKKTRLFGYGHRVYKARDPRLSLVEELMDKYESVVEHDTLLNIARRLEATADKDDYFIQRGLRANADLKGCFLYTAFGFDTEMSTALMTLSRLSGVLAHWRESQGQPVKIWRPQQIYTGRMTQSTSTAVSTNDLYHVRRKDLATSIMDGFWKSMHLMPYRIAGFYLKIKSVISFYPMSTKQWKEAAI